MSFYEASYIVMPYLVTFLENVKDFEWQCYLISQMGTCVMTDIPSNHYKTIEDEEIIESYNASIEVLKQITEEFIDQYAQQIKCLDEDELSYMAPALLGILGNKEEAYVINLLCFNECYTYCEQCEYCNEEMGDLSEEIPDFIIPKQNVIENWNRKDYTNTYVWLSSLLQELNAEALVKRLSCYYGTYICPQCKTHHNMMDAIKAYFEI